MEDENRRLIPMTIKHLDGDNWIVSIDGGESYSIKGEFDSIKKVCRRIKAKDGENNNKCRSAKVGTYSSMISETDNEEHHINVWKSKVPYTAEEFRKLMENKIMKSIKLTKNYILEGNIIPKGTIVEFKEKLDFLPNDIWETAKSIDDEHERFEFIKAELNKLGDSYSDDEIEDFINKYKNDLKESLTEEVEGFDDMMDMIKETLEFEKKYTEEECKQIIEESKKDDGLLNAWEKLLNASDKSFNKKESEFWGVFDKLCARVKKELEKGKKKNGDKKSDDEEK